jgi:prepilin-type N-terminal cleavage/methylation domain-containing protein
VSQRGFSLIELVIVIAILAIVAAIAVPRFSRGVDGAASSALASDLAILHRAVEHYAAEHGGRFPDADRVVRQLTEFTDCNGDVSAERTATHIYGPYLRSIPPVPLGPRRGQIGAAAEPGPGVGWIYDAATGQFAANLTP